MISLENFLSAVKFAQDGSLFPGSELHGDDHWRAVASQATILAEQNNMGREGLAAAALFGLFHDCRRENDGWDAEHGLRGGRAMLDCPHLHKVPSSLIKKLAHSCTLHDSGQVTDDPIMGLGWDADRSVLTRVGVEPDITFFSCIQEQSFIQFIESGLAATRMPPSWEQIWANAFR